MSRRLGDTPTLKPAPPYDDVIPWRWRAIGLAVAGCIVYWGIVLVVALEGDVLAALVVLVGFPAAVILAAAAVLTAEGKRDQ